MTNRRTRILGKMFPQFLGKDVIVLGRVTKMGSDGKTIELTTFDDIKVNVAALEPVETQVTDVLEVWGSVKSKGTMSAERCVVFTDENCQDFNKKRYIDLVLILHAAKNQMWKLNAKTSLI